MFSAFMVFSSLFLGMPQETSILWAKSWWNCGGVIWLCHHNHPTPARDQGQPVPHWNQFYRPHLPSKRSPHGKKNIPKLQLQTKTYSFSHPAVFLVAAVSLFFVSFFSHRNSSDAAGPLAAPGSHLLPVDPPLPCRAPRPPPRRAPRPWLGSGAAGRRPPARCRRLPAFKDGRWLVPKKRCCNMF